MDADDAQRLTSDQRRVLLTVARDALTARAEGRSYTTPVTTDPALSRRAAAFVTLKKHGKLRGCIGCTEAEMPLIETVRQFAVSAGMHDPRFPPVAAEEIREITIEISVLSPLRKVESPEEIIVGEHGVMVQQGQRRGLFLPQVATEHGLDRERFLSLLCAHKAGLPENAWRGEADLYVFTVDKFGE